LSASGVVQAKKPGKATIKVLSIFYSFNYDEVQGTVYVLLCPHSIKCPLTFLLFALWNLLKFCTLHNLISNLKFLTHTPSNAIQCLHGSLYLSLSHPYCQY
ncbi:unnamed protein product, partial [Prunus brigantina]